MRYGRHVQMSDPLPHVSTRTTSDAKLRSQSQSYSQNVRPVTLVVHSDSEFLGWVAEECGISENVYSLTTDGRKEDVKIATGEQLWVHSSCLCCVSARDIKKMCGEFMSLTLEQRSPEQLL